MAVTFRSVGVSPGASSTTCVIVKPAGLAVDDLMVAHVVGNGNSAAHTAPANWTEIRQDDGGTLYRRVSLWWKIAVQADVDATDFTFTVADQTNLGAITAWTGHDPNTPINAHNGQSNEASTTVTAPTITPSVANCEICLFCGQANDVSFGSYAIANDNPASWTERYDQLTTAGFDCAQAMGSASRPETTATGNGTATASGSNKNVGQLIAIAPAAAAEDFERSLSTAIALVPVLSPQKALLRTFTTAIGLVTVLTRGLTTFGRTLSTEIGLVAALTSMHGWVRTLTTAIGLVSTLSAGKDLLRSLTTAIGLLAPHAWLLGWDKRIKLTIDNTDIDAALVDFPILVHLSTSSGRNNDDVSRVFDELTADANRKKIAVTTSDGITQCYVEIEKWDDANEEAWLWVKVPAIASDADTELYLYYDADHADNTDYVGDTNSTPAENVWGNGYFITHFKDDPDNAHIRDSSSYSSDGDKRAANQPQEVAGDKTAYAQDFDLTNPDYIAIPADQTQLDFTSEDFSIIARVKVDSFVLSRIVFYRGLSSVDGYSLYLHATGKIHFATSQTPATQTTESTAGDMVIATWYTVGLSRSGASAELYKNGVDVTATPAVHIDPDSCLRTAKIGLHNDSVSNPFDGKIEFLGIFGGVALTPAFHKAFDQSITDDLLAFGAEEVTLSRLVTFGRTLTTEMGLVAILDETKELFRSFSTAIGLVASLGAQKNLFRAFATEVGLVAALSSMHGWVRSLTAVIGLDVSLSVQKNQLRTLASVIGLHTLLRWTTSARRRIASVGTNRTVGEVGDNREVKTTGENRDREAF